MKCKSKVFIGTLSLNSDAIVNEFLAARVSSLKNYDFGFAVIDIKLTVVTEAC